MRWFVEVSPIGQKGAAVSTFVVEAAQWQPALQTARKLEGGDGALNNFSIELLEDGYRAIDPASRRRYVIRRAPDDAVLTNGAGAAAAAQPAAVARPVAAAQPVVIAKAPLEPVPVTTPSVGVEPSKKRASAQTVAFSSAGAAAIREAVEGKPPVVVPNDPAPPAPAAPAAAARPASAAGVPGFTLVGKREDNPSERSPLSYREYVYAVPEDTSDEAAGRIVLQSFVEVRKELESARPGKLINLAVFDHVFQGRPLRAPIVTLTWKDWKGVEPEIRFPLRDGAGETPTPMAGPASGVPASAMAMLGGAAAGSAPATMRAATSAPVVSAASPAQASGRSSPAPTPSSAPIATPSPVSAPRPEPVAVVVSTPVAAPKPIEAAPIPSPAAAAAPTPVASPHPAPDAAPAAQPLAARDAGAAKDAAAASAPRPPPPSSKRRLSGDDLLGELFEAFSDLHFLRETLEGADFVLALAMENLPCEIGLISLFDINRREYVVVRQLGGARAILCARQPERAALADTAMRKRHAIVVSDPAGARRAMDERWHTAGVELRGLMCAPVEVGGRYLGLIELANPTGVGVFSDGDGNALTYIGEQFAEFVAARGVVVDPEIIRAPPPKGR